MKMGLNSLARSYMGVISAFALVLVVLVVALAVITPMRGKVARMRVELDEMVKRNAMAVANVRKVKDLEILARDLSERLGAETNRYLLRPVLGSYPVQRDIYRLAAETNFKIKSVKELGKKITPVDIEPAKKNQVAKAPPIRNKDQSLFARYTVEISGEGSYLDFVSLIGKLEGENPYCGVVEFRINGDRGSPEIHSAAATLEWPVLDDTGAHGAVAAKLK